MVKILLILFAAVGLYVSISWILDSFKKTNKDDGGKVFGSIILIVTLGCIISYFLGFMYPVIVVVGSMGLTLTVISLGLLNEDHEVFSGSGTIFGALTWFLGIAAAYTCVQLMLAEGWYSICICLVAAFTVIAGIAVIKRELLKKTFSFGYLLTFLLLLLGEVLISNTYPVDHLAIVITSIAVMIVAALVPTKYVKKFSLT